MLLQLPKVKKLKQVAAQEFIVDLPRYQEFTSVASELAERDVHFVEIAGNSYIVMSALAPQSWHYDRDDGQELFSISVLTRQEIKRVVIGCNVTSLDAVLNALRARGVAVEHIYDY